MFSDLVNGRIKDVNFIWEEALNFNGNSGPYVQYTYARACSVLEKAGVGDGVFDVPLAQHQTKAGVGVGRDDPGAPLENFSVGANLRNVGGDVPYTDNSVIITNNLEREIIKLLSQFPEKVLIAEREYEPSVICRYLLDLCAAFNRFYHDCSILKAESDEIKNSRLALCEAVKYTIGNGLWLIGLEKTNRV